jgi:divalent metal cation (Fe/Co/Zn/Cd) transporter
MGVDPTAGHPVYIGHLGLVAAAGVVGFIGNETVAMYLIRVPRQINPAALEADGQRVQADGLISFAVVLGATSVALGFRLPTQSSVS